MQNDPAKYLTLSLNSSVELLPLASVTTTNATEGGFIKKFDK